MEPSTDFAAGLARVVADLQAACACRLVWKDADPAAWTALPPDLATHRNRFCLAVKRGGGRVAACMAADNLLERDWPPGAGPRLRTCPFGVREVAVPVAAAGTYHGCVLIGPWRDPDAAPPAGLAALHAALPPFPGEAAALAMARLAAAALAPLLDARAADAARRGAEAAGDALMARAVAVVGARLDARLRAAAVAAEVGLSVSRFLHRFRAATGETFHGHVARRLMAEAARRLAAPRAQVTAIALDLGFASPAYFATAFRRIHGCAPGAFRERLRSAGA